MVNKDRHKVKCRYCNKVLGGGIYRFKEQLANVAWDAKGCTNVHIEVRNEIRSLLFGKKAEKEMKKKYVEGVARMVEFIDEDDVGGDEDLRELKRGMKTSQEKFASEQDHKHGLKYRPAMVHTSWYIAASVHTATGMDRYV